MFAPYLNPKLPTRPRHEDPDDVRLGACAQIARGPLADTLTKIKEDDFVLLGYPDDRGVDRNGGRLGASDAPDEIRKFLYNMTPDPLAAKGVKPPTIWDLGNFKSWSLNLPEAHEEARRRIKEIRERGARIISLGGGHDWAYSDFADFRERIINVDAHLDMRPLNADQDFSSHSGTPFRRILGQRPDASSLAVLGLQRHCNARTHLEFAKSLRARMLFLEEMPWDMEAQWSLVSDRFGLDSENDRFALSVDMDAFSQTHAPGVSAPQSFGVDPRLVLRLVDTLGARMKHLGIYELNPLYDQDGKTARLAAKIIYQFMFRAN